MGSIGITDDTITMHHSALRGEVIKIERETTNGQNLFKKTAVQRRLLFLDNEKYAQTQGPPVQWQVQTTMPEEGEQKKRETTIMPNIVEGISRLIKGSKTNEKSAVKPRESLELRANMVKGDTHDVDQPEGTIQAESEGSAVDGVRSVDEVQGGDQGKTVDKGKAVDRGDDTKNKPEGGEVVSTRQSGQKATIHVSRVTFDQLSDGRLKQGWVAAMKTQGLLKICVKSQDDKQDKWLCETVCHIAKLTKG